MLINIPLAQRGQQSQKFGRSKCWFSTKAHATTDSLGCPTRFILTGGNESDYLQAVPLIENQQADYVIADKGYDSQAIVDAIKSKGAEPVIPARSHRKASRDYDRYIYKERNAIERMFNKIKQFRRIATRYDKLAIAYLSFLHVAAIAVWLR